MIRILSKMNLSEIRSHLGKFRVGIARAGGLGSNCAIALARSGVGTLVLSDFDIIEESNLTRQYYFTDQVGMLKTIALKENISRVNPDVFVIVHQKELNRTNIPEIFSGCNFIVEGFDSCDMKEMLCLKKFSYKMRIIKINGGLISKDEYDNTIIHEDDDVQMLYLMSGG